jgi:hypothetical protein
MRHETARSDVVLSLREEHQVRQIPTSSQHQQQGNNKINALSTITQSQAQHARKGYLFKLQTATPTQPSSIIATFTFTKQVKGNHLTKPETL